MPKTSGHSWRFKARFRRHAFGWKSQPAMMRLHEAVSEITLVARIDPMLGAEGAVALLERISPALENVDSSSGAIGTAVNHTIAELVPVIVAQHVGVLRHEPRIQAADSVATPASTNMNPNQLSCSRQHARRDRRGRRRRVRYRAQERRADSPMARSTTTDRYRLAVQARDLAAHDSTIVGGELDAQTNGKLGQLDQLSRRSNQAQAFDEPSVQTEQNLFRESRDVDRDECHRQNQGLSERQAK